MLGEKTVEGKSNIREWMSSMEGKEPPKFTVDYLLADGDAVAASGDMTMKDEEGNMQPYAYCDIYRFNGGKVTELRTFVAKTAEANRSASA
jgi:ketosteroid isomerase-like protein